MKVRSSWWKWRPWRSQKWSRAASVLSCSGILWQMVTSNRSIADWGVSNYRRGSVRVWYACASKKGASSLSKVYACVRIMQAKPTEWCNLDWPWIVKLSTYFGYKAHGNEGLRIWIAIRDCCCSSGNFHFCWYEGGRVDEVTIDLENS